MAVFRHVTLGQESQSTIDKHCLLRPFTVFSAPVMAPKSDAPFIGLLVRQVSIVFFGIFDLTSVSFGVGFDPCGREHGAASVRDHAASERYACEVSMAWSKMDF